MIRAMVRAMAGVLLLLILWISLVLTIYVFLEFFISPFYPIPQLGYPIEFYLAFISVEIFVFGVIISIMLSDVAKIAETLDKIVECVNRE